MNYRPITTLLTVALLATACSKNESDPIPAASEYAIEVGTPGIAPATRALQPLAEGAAFGVLAYTCDGSFSSTESLPDLLYNARAEKYVTGGNIGYRYLPTAHWPVDTKKVQFAAYYPHNSSIAAGAITVSPFTSVGLPKITVVMGLEKGSVDFATSVVGPIKREYTGINPSGGTDPTLDPFETPARTTNFVNFEFKRHMAYVSFRCKAVNQPNIYTKLYINQVTLRNIYRKGTFDMAATSGNEWIDRGIDATTGATLNLSSMGAPVSEGDFKDLTDPTNTGGTMFSVIPQTYDNVELSIIYTLEYLKADGGCEHRIVGFKTVPMTVDWTAGKQHITDLEFSFNEAYGEKPLFNFTVTSWGPVDVPTTMN